MDFEKFSERKAENAKQNTSIIEEGLNKIALKYLGLNGNNHISNNRAGATSNAYTLSKCIATNFVNNSSPKEHEDFVKDVLAALNSSDA